MERTKTENIRWVWIIILLPVFILCSILMLGRKNPSYEGRPLVYWMHQLPFTFSVIAAGNTNVVTGASMTDQFGRKYGAFIEKPADSLAAMRAMGANALPFLLRNLGRRSLPLQSW